MKNKGYQMISAILIISILSVIMATQIAVTSALSERNLEIIWLDKYDNIEPFSEGLAKVSKNGMYGYINQQGQEIIPLNYYDADSFSEGLARVRSGSKWGYINKQGKQIISAIYDRGLNFVDGLACVNIGGKWGYINKQGTQVTETIYSAVDNLSDGMARVVIGKKVGYINKQGSQVIPLIYYDGWNFSEGLAAIGVKEMFSTRMGYIDKQGNQVIPATYDDAWAFSEGLARVEIDYKTGYINKNGEQVIPTIYDKAWDFSKELARVEIANKFGYINKRGEQIIPLVYSALGFFSEDLVEVGIDNKYGYIDKQGKQVIPAIYDYAYPFSEGLAVVVKESKKGYIDKQGQELTSFIFDHASDFSDGVAIVSKDGRHGILKNPLKKTSVKSPAISPAMESFVRRAIGKLTGELTDSDWNQLTSLDLTGVSLENLEGLEKAGNLKEINLSFALITDISALEGSTNLKKIILTNSRLTKLQIDHLKSKLPQVEWMVKEVSITDAAVKNWNIAQTGDDLSGSAEQIIAEAGKQEVKAADGMVVINKKLTESGLAKAEAVKEQLYAKAAGENKELNKALDTVVKVELEQAGSGRTEMNIRIAKEVKDLKEVDKLVVEVDSEISLEISSEQLQENITANDLEISIEEVKKDSGFLPHAQGERGEIQIGFGGEGESFKRYRIKMKKGKNDAKIGISLKSPDSPYTAIFRKTDKGEEVIGGKYDAKTKKLTVKVGEDGEYYVKKNEKNFSDIEKLSGVQKEMIKVLASKGILKGDEKGRFNPNAGISRSELLTILVRLSYVYDDKAISNFSDVKAGSWYYPFVSSGQKIGVVNGYPDNTFKPENPVGAAELAKMNTMMLVYKKGYHFPQKNDLYLAKLAKSSNIPEWAVSYIAMAEREGFLLKNSSGVYDGTKTMTREEAAEMLYRLWEKL